MTSVRVILAGLGLAVVVAAPPAGAQSLAPVRTTDVGIAIGGAFPMGDRLRGPQPFSLESPSRDVDVAGGTNAGFTIAGSVGITPVNSPVAYRLEAQYTRFGLDPDPRFGPGGAPETADGHLSSLSGIASVVVTIPIAGRFRPYLIGGAGVYRLTSDITQEPNSTFGPTGVTRFGLNGGAGVEVAVGPLRTFVEARYHNAFASGSDVSFVPVTIGMKFWP
ncbi:MAG: outer membrane protein [Gemmatimonadaceae bacterium]